jgi:hypothetical protein
MPIFKTIQGKFFAENLADIFVFVRRLFAGNGPQLRRTPDRKGTSRSSENGLQKWFPIVAEMPARKPGKTPAYLVLLPAVVKAGCFCKQPRRQNWPAVVSGRMNVAQSEVGFRFIGL